ncbi:uncharacterized protein PV07_12673 [Cladophialophora immunda]|uniref:Uncharacterized protein n=1 Tax=Cladophialophora immunda TaxID=569365 RepID=A0A0D2AAX7_9EURO|nr:uncharacterized protein PV07_12673 [Cladophialophora immunda]KIW21917.1 hypothetical protein PV07_12673 [Cladophialophora immunda]
MEQALERGGPPKTVRVKLEDQNGQGDQMELDPKPSSGQPGEQTPPRLQSLPLPETAGHAKPSGTRSLPLPRQPGHPPGTEQPRQSEYGEEDVTPDPRLLKGNPKTIKADKDLRDTQDLEAAEGGPPEFKWKIKPGTVKFLIPDLWESGKYRVTSKDDVAPKLWREWESREDLQKFEFLLAHGESVVMKYSGREIGDEGLYRFHVEKRAKNYIKKGKPESNYYFGWVSFRWTYNEPWEHCVLNMTNLRKLFRSGYLLEKLLPEAYKKNGWLYRDFPLSQKQKAESAKFEEAFEAGLTRAPTMVLEAELRRRSMSTEAPSPSVEVEGGAFPVRARSGSARVHSPWPTNTVRARTTTLANTQGRRGTPLPAVYTSREASVVPLRTTFRQGTPGHAPTSHLSREHSLIKDGSSYVLRGGTPSRLDTVAVNPPVVEQELESIDERLERMAGEMALVLEGKIQTMQTQIQTELSKLSAALSGISLSSATGAVAAH